jgi:RND family efflux transporter MFP subunit
MTPFASMFTIACSLGVAEPLAPPRMPEAELTPSRRLLAISAGFARPAREKGPVRLLRVDETLPLPGATHPTRRATLGVPFDSMLTEISVVEGQRVREGEVIAVLDNRVAREALRIAEIETLHTASVERARAVLERAEESLRRAETARESGAMGPERLSEARHRRDLAAADVRFAEEVLEKAHAQYTLAKARLEEHLIRAPFGGVVARVHADPGEVLSPGEPVAEVIDADSVLVDLYVPSGEAITLRAGDRVALALADPIGAVAVGVVRYAEPRVDPTSRTTRVVFAFEAPDRSIPAGVQVTLADRVPGERDEQRLRDVVLARAVRPDDASPAVATVDPGAE